VIPDRILGICIILELRAPGSSESQRPSDAEVAALRDAMGQRVTVNRSSRGCLAEWVPAEAVERGKAESRARFKERIGALLDQAEAEVRRLIPDAADGAPSWVLATYAGSDVVDAAARGLAGAAEVFVARSPDE
jgi:hypothetical protein